MGIFDRKPKNVAEAQKVIEKLSSNRDFEGLIKALRHKNIFIKVAAKKALDKLGWKPKNITDEVRYLIAGRDFFNLGKLGEPAVELLMKILNEEDWDEDFEAHREVISTLGGMGDKRAVESIIPALYDKYWEIRSSAAWALTVLDWKPDDITDEVHYLIGMRVWHYLWETWITETGEMTLRFTGGTLTSGISPDPRETGGSCKVNELEGEWRSEWGSLEDKDKVEKRGLNLYICYNINETEKKELYYRYSFSNWIKNPSGRGYYNTLILIDEKTDEEIVLTHISDDSP